AGGRGIGRLALLPVFAHRVVAEELGDALPRLLVDPRAGTAGHLLDVALPFFRGEARIDGPRERVALAALDGEDLVALALVRRVVGHVDPVRPLVGVFGRHGAQDEREGQGARHEQDPPQKTPPMPTCPAWNDAKSLNHQYSYSSLE